MTTLVDALIAIIDAQWGNGGGGGTEPTTIAALTDYRTLTVARTTTDHIYLELQTVRREPVNNVYDNVTSRIAVTTITATSDTRLKELADEIRWICNNVAVTGVDSQHVVEERDMTDRVQKVFIYQLVVECVEHLVEGATAYAAPATVYDMRAALMIGSANVTYVPCVFEIEHVSHVGKVCYGSGTTLISNVDATDMSLRYNLPLPTNRGGLKLYVTGFRISVYDADADDYVTLVTMYGTDHDTITSLLAEPTDRTAQGAYVSTVAATDCSVYKQVEIVVGCSCTTAGDLDIAAVEVNCYYDT